MCSPKDNPLPVLPLRSASSSRLKSYCEESIAVITVIVIVIGIVIVVVIVVVIHS